MLNKEETFEVPHSENDTDVIGDVGAFMRYYRRGIAHAEWKQRIDDLVHYFDAVDAPHINATCGHIIIPPSLNRREENCEPQDDPITDQPPRNDTYLIITIVAMITACIPIAILYSGIVSPEFIHNLARLCGLAQ